MRRAAIWIATAVLAGCAAPPPVHFGPTGAFTDDTELQMSLQDSLFDRRPVLGNKVTLSRDGPATLRAMFAAMREARDHIDLEYYTFDNVSPRPNGPGTAHVQTLGELLLDRLAHGVRVDVLYDSLGSFDTGDGFLSRLRAAGAHVLAFNPGLLTQGGRFSNPNNRDHRKILVVDGRTAFVGGVNLDPVYANRPGNEAVEAESAFWRDIDARIDGPAVADLQRLFLDDWRRQSGEALPPRAWFPPLTAQGNEAVRILGSAPGEDRPLFYISALTAIHAARRAIDLSTGYFVPTHQEREELVHAARRGVRVRLMLPGKSDSPTSLAAGQAAYDDLLEAGASIVELRADVLHAKILVVDGVWTAIGSSNLDWRSVLYNDEVDAIVFGSATGNAMETLLDRDRALGVPLDLASWRARPWWRRPREVLARVWEFLL